MVLAVLAVACTTDPTLPSAVLTETLVSGQGLDHPSDVALRPGTNEAWVTNAGADSITIVRLDAHAATVLRTGQDAFAEHFVARPAGLAFDERGARFAVANDSINEVRDMDFKINPERNVYFKGSHFMGPTLFAADTFALAGQSKKYLEDWPQPGYGHDPPDDVPQDQCPPQYWSVEVQGCQWPREGSHLDMLHSSPSSAGIVHDATNVFWVLDGCGSRTATNQCKGDGHVVLYDFNRDHQEGNGFHGDGVTRRVLDARFTRVDGISSGMAIHDGWLYYADTGGGQLRRLRLDSGRVQVMVDAWHGHDAARGETGPGVISWDAVEQGPGDGDTPPVIDQWIAQHGDAAAIAAAGDRWIKPQEVLSEYSYLQDPVVETVAVDGLQRPSGIAAGPDALFVADHATGTIHEHRWDGRPGRRFVTGRSSLTGLAYRPGDGGTLVFTDRDTNALLALRLP